MRPPRVAGAAWRKLYAGGSAAARGELALQLLFAFGVRQYALDSRFIPTDSMAPTFLPGE